LQGNTGDYLITAGAYGERSIIFFTNSFVVLSGTDHANFDWMPRNLGVGCTVRESYQVKDGYAIFANEKGIYRMDESFVPVLISSPIKSTYNGEVIEPSVTTNYFWLQSTLAEWQSGTYRNIIDTASVAGKIMQKPQTTQADWQAAGTKTNVDLTTSAGNVLITTSSGVDLLSGKTPFQSTLVYGPSKITDSNDSTYGVVQGFPIFTLIYLINFTEKFNSKFKQSML
jgi:hypothetical protein